MKHGILAFIDAARAEMERIHRVPVDLAKCSDLTREVVMFRAEQMAGRPFAIAGGDGEGVLDRLGIDGNADLAELGEALRKAAITTGTSADALLDPVQGSAFIEAVSDKTVLTSRMRVEEVDRTSGSIEKMAVGTGLIRAAAENTDTGYRAEPTFATVPYQGVEVMLPWEITLQFLRRNVEGSTIDEKIWNAFTRAFAVDLERLDILGDTGSADPSLSIDNGLLKLLTTSSADHMIDAAEATIGVAWPDKAILFALEDALPEKYRGGALRESDGEDGDRPVLIMSRGNRSAWTEYLTDRDTAAGDAALGASGDLVNRPLGYEIVSPAGFPSDKIVMTNPKNLVRVVTNNIERYRVGPGSDWELTMKRKVGRVFFMERDFIVEEMGAIAWADNVGD